MWIINPAFFFFFQEQGFHISCADSPLSLMLESHIAQQGHITFVLLDKEETGECLSSDMST